jgi:hypothetical protein
MKPIIIHLLSVLVIPSASLLITKIAYASSPEESKLTEVEFFSGTAADLVFPQNNQSILQTDEANSINNQSFLIPKTDTSEPPITNTNKLIVDDSSNAENEKEDQSWEFKIQPYYTIPWRVYGEATVEGITVDLDLGLGDLLDSLQAYVNTRFEAWHGNWGIIVDASYWSFSGIGDFQENLNLNNKIRQRIKEDIEFFTNQEIDKVEQLLDREQEFFQAIEEKEKTLARQLIGQEIEGFRQQLINQIKNQENRENLQEFNLAEQLKEQQLLISNRFRNAEKIAQELKNLEEQLLTQTLNLNRENQDFSLPESEKRKLAEIKKIIEKIKEQTELTENILPFERVKKDLGNNLNKTQYTLALKQELNQLEDKLEQALQDIMQLQAFRDSVLEKGLELEIQILRDLLNAEIGLLQDFAQRIEDGFSKIYDETLMVLEDLQQFRNAITSSDPSPSELDLAGDLSLDYHQGTYDFALSYHFGEQPVPYNPDENNYSANFPLFWFEPIAGVRLNDFYTGIDADISYGFDGEVIDVNGSFRESFVEKRTWFEPMVGAKLGLQVSPPITLWLRGDVSGFGLAGETNLSWNFISGMDWWVSPRTSILLAYRFYEFSYGNGENLLDINFNGPLIGITYNF